MDDTGCLAGVIIFVMVVSLIGSKSCSVRVDNKEASVKLSETQPATQPGKQVVYQVYQLADGKKMLVGESHSYPVKNQNGFWVFIDSNTMIANSFTGEVLVEEKISLEK